MSYKSRRARLLMLIGLLAVAYGGTFLFDPHRRAGEASFWLDAASVGRVSRIELVVPGGENARTVVLARKNDAWWLVRNGVEYPARQERVADLLTLLSTKANYPLRARRAQAHEKLGLGEKDAPQISLYAAAGTAPLLTLLVGDRDSAGQETYLRRAGDDTTRSGPVLFSAYLQDGDNKWAELHLFPPSRQQGLTADKIQRVLVQHEGASYILARDASRRWIIEGAADRKVDVLKAESYLKAIVEAEAEDVVSADAATVDARGSLITVELGDTKTVSIAISGPTEMDGPAGPGNGIATLSNSRYVYALAAWTLERLLRGRDYFFATSG